MLERGLQVIGSRIVESGSDEDLATADNGTLKPHPVTSLEGFVQHADDSVVAIIRRLRSQKGVLRKKKFEDLQKSLGFN